MDELIALEEKLTEALGASAEVDGHDSGSGEANIFIFCDEPAGVFARCVPFVSSAGLLPLLAAAYIPEGGDRYTRLWPTGEKRPFDVA